MEIESKSIVEMMPSEVKIWLSGLGAQENFNELKDGLMDYLDELYEITLEARMEKTRCIKCNCLGVRVELTDIWGGDKKMVCRECFDSI